MLHLCTAESPEEHAFPLLYNFMRHFRIPPRTRSRWRIFALLEMGRPAAIQNSSSLAVTLAR